MTWLQQTSALAVLSAALALTYTIEEHRLHTERARSAEMALHASNAAAQRDSTRNLALANRKVAALLGDSLHAVERTVVQIAGRRDAMDRALGRERLARYMMAVTVDSMTTMANASTDPVAEGADRVRHASFDVPEFHDLFHREHMSGCAGDVWDGDDFRFRGDPFVDAF